LLVQDLVFCVTGPTPPEDWSKLSGKAVATLAKAGSPGEKPAVPTLDKPVHVEKVVPKEQAVMHLAYPTVPVSHPDQIALAILDEALSDLGSRLFVRIREELGLAYFVGTSQFLGLEAGPFFFYLC